MDLDAPSRRVGPCPSRKSTQCQCPGCLGPGPHPDRGLHRQMNLLLSRLDEQQRRWYAAVEIAKLGHGGDRTVSRITGLHVDTIRRGREELAASLEDRPADRVRLPGGGPPRPRKKVPLIIPALLSIVGPQTGGDPMGETKFVRREPGGPQHGTGRAGLLGLPHDRGPAPAGPAATRPGSTPSGSPGRTTPTGTGSSATSGTGSTSSRSWASRSSASTARRRS